jgi:hypothetical protein
MRFLPWKRVSGRWWARLFAAWLILTGLMQLEVLRLSGVSVLTTWVLPLLALAAGILLLLDR